MEVNGAEPHRMRSKTPRRIALNAVVEPQAPTCATPAVEEDGRQSRKRRRVSRVASPQPQPVGEPHGTTVARNWMHPLHTWPMSYCLPAAEHMSVSVNSLIMTKFACDGMRLPNPLLDKAELFRARIRLLQEKASSYPKKHKAGMKGAYRLSLSCKSPMDLYRQENGFLVGQKCRRLMRVQPSFYEGKQVVRLKNVFVPEEPRDAPKAVYSMTMIQREASPSALMDESMNSQFDVDDLIVSTECASDRWRYLRTAHASTGKELTKVWLSNSFPFSILDANYKLSTISVRTSKFKTVEYSPSGKKEPCIIALSWHTFPFRYEGGFIVRGEIFGMNLEALGFFDDTLVVCLDKGVVELFDLSPFWRAASSVKVELGQLWDLDRYPFSTVGNVRALPKALRGDEMKYGDKRWGMPLTFEFKEKPPRLYKLHTEDQFLSMSTHLNHFLLADKNSFYVFDTKWNRRVDGPAIVTAGIVGMEMANKEAVLLVDTKPERLAAWNGYQLVLFALVRNQPGHPCALVADFAVRPTHLSAGGFSAAVTPLDAGTYSDLIVRNRTGKEMEGWTCEYLDYDYTMDILIVLFGDLRTAGYFLVLLEGKTVTLLTIVTLDGKSVSDLGGNEIEVDECGLSHYYRHIKGNFHVWDYYTLRPEDEEPNCQSVVCEVDIPALGKPCPLDCGWEKCRLTRLTD